MTSAIDWWLRISSSVIAIPLMCVQMAAALDPQIAPASRSDFSGDWVLESASQAPADVPRTLSVRQFQLAKRSSDGSTKVTLTSIAIERTLETGSVSETHQIGIRGGTVGGIGKDGRSPSTSYGVNWDGNALVFENESHSERVDPATWNERREVWSLDETGRLQIVITNRGWDGPARRLTLLYRRP